MYISTITMCIYILEKYIRNKKPTILFWRPTSLHWGLSAVREVRASVLLLLIETTSHVLSSFQLFHLAIHTKWRWLILTDWPEPRVRPVLLWNLYYFLFSSCGNCTCAISGVMFRINVICICCFIYIFFFTFTL